MTSYTREQLEQLARQARRLILTTVAASGAGHVGGPLSAVDVLIALYFSVLRIRPQDPAWTERDRFVLSKGHSAIALYVVLALRGYFPLEELPSFDAIDSRLQGHPDMALLPGIDMSTGSLGLGFSAALGIALAGKSAHKPFLTFAMLGDGECNEGIVWEAAHVAARYQLGHLRAIIDCNGLQQFGWANKERRERLAPYELTELCAMWSAFGWDVVEIDGHDMSGIIETLSAPRNPDRPLAVLARTIKGKGVSFMEGDYHWHAAIPDEGQLTAALAELADPGSPGAEHGS